MTKYTEIVCDCCLAKQMGIVDDMEYTWTEIIRGPSLAEDGFRPRHLCPVCALKTFEFIMRTRNNNDFKLHPETKTD